MKKSIYYLLIIPVLYSAFMLYKGPSLSDAIIVLSLAGMVSFLSYLNVKFTPSTENKELSDLEESLKVERLKLSIETIKENALREKSIRDSRAAMMGYEQDREIKF